jgi:hypothetical protein
MKNLFFTLCATIISASAATAEHHEQNATGKAGMAYMEAKMEHYFANIDTNKDGKISLEEQTAQCKKKFEQTDADKDGFLTKEEIKSNLEAKKRNRAGMRHNAPHAMQPAPNGTAPVAAPTPAPSNGAVQPAHPAP